MRTCFLVVFATTLMLGITSASAQGGYIIKVEGDKIYLNLPNAKVSDVVSVLDNGGFMTDSRTGREIRREPEVIGQIKIIAVQGTYAVGKVYGNATSYPEEGMTVRKGTVMQRNDYGEATVMIAPAELNWPEVKNVMVGDGNGNEGYIGDYVSAALMKQLLKSGNIQVVDRSILGAYQQSGMYQQSDGIYEKEMELNNRGIIDSNTMLQYGKMSGVRYLLKITLLKPDVVNINNKIPVKGITNALSNATNSNKTGRTNKTQDLLPDQMETNNIKVSIKVATHLIDIQTGRVLFITDDVGTASGAPQIDLELGSNYNLTLNRKNVDFMQTVTGKAIDNAFKKIGKELNNYFDKQLKN